MKILVVNDDGYDAIGLEILSNAFKKYGSVYVVAPHFHQSGASSSITVRSGLTVHKHAENFYSVEGTPADCTKYGLFALNQEFDLVVSGVNNGFNIGIDTIYSGTIGATMEALFHSKKGIAFSADIEDYDKIRREIDDVIKYIFKYDLLSHDYLLNVNFTKKAFEKSKGILITDLFIEKHDVIYENKDNRAHFSRVFHKTENIMGTDLYAFKNGYISITPLKLGNGDKTIVNHLLTKINHQK